MRSSEIRKRFIDYFAGKGHTVVPSSSLLPKGDQTLLFTNAGMVQFKKVFLEEETRPYKTAVTCQRCMRAGGKHNDLENVGRTARHHTFFEMLGNFSFGDYFKQGAIEYAWDFLTKVMELPESRLYVTIFETDDEAGAIWRKVSGLPDERIIKLGAKDNFWSMGDVGPCGPCSEILIDQGPEAGCGSPTCAVGCDCDRYLELWNLVFMQYNRDADGTLTPLPKPCIDTGMGLERLTAVMQGKKTNYDSDLFSPIINEIEDASSRKYGADHEMDVSIKAIADHARATTFLMADGVLPSNEGRGYVLRRIIRRAVRHGRLLGLDKPFLYRINARVIASMGAIFPEITRAKDLIERATRGEEERFLETLDRGLGLLDEQVRLLKEKNEQVIPGEIVFKLYDTFGFPADLTAIIVGKEGFTVDEDGFAGYMDEQRKMARKAWKGAEGTVAGAGFYSNLANEGLKTEFVGYHMEAVSSRILFIVKDGASAENAYPSDKVEIITGETPFYAESGGQTGDTGVIVGKGFSVRVLDTRKHDGLTVHHCKVTEGTVSVDDVAELVPDIEKRNATRRNHTATHILHATLRRVIGEHVRQAGSLVDPRGLRFDFTHFESLDDDTLGRIETEANRAVLANIEVKTDVLPYKEAIERGALAFFDEKYGDTVRMVQVAGVSAELCGGTHANRTGDIGLIKITGESSVAAGVRRLEAVTGEGAIEMVAKNDAILKEASFMLKAPRHTVPEKIKRLIDNQRSLEKEIERLQGASKAGQAEGMLGRVKSVNGISVLASKVDAADAKALREMADALRAKLGTGIVVLGVEQGEKALILAAVTRDLTTRFKAGEIIKSIAPVVGGKGGGKDDLAQAGGTAPEKIEEALELALRIIAGQG